MGVANRLSRYGDWSTLQPLCQSGTDGMRPFFAGDNVASRMDQVRRAINEIRARWDQYPAHMAELRAYMASLGVSAEQAGEEGAERIAALFASVKQWADWEDPSQAGPPDDEYSAIRLYTSEPGYRQIFGTINSAFRSVGLTNDAKALRSAAFLVELLSIDLYNYRHRNTDVDNFEGVVYRGMCVSAEELSSFVRAAAGPVPQRYLSIPLAMVSTSRDKESAMSFALEQAARHPDRHPLVWKIHVHGLSRELLAVYRSAFPRSTVTSLCAVPVDQLSDFSDEKEVLLRGPFFHILRLRETSEPGYDEPLHTVEALMLNSNRDHVSTVASNEGEDRRARDLFRTLVTAQKHALCREFAATHGMAQDAETYDMLQGESRAALSRYLDRG